MMAIVREVVMLFDKQMPSLSLTSLDLSCPGHFNASLSVSSISVLASAIKNHVTLLELDMQWNGLTGACIEVLADSLVHNTSINTLCLSYNPLSCTGAVALATLLASNSTLLRLYLDHTDIADHGAEVLLQSLQTRNRTLLELSLRGICNRDRSIVGASVLSMVRTNRTLRVLDLRDIGHLPSDDDLSMMAAAKQENRGLEIQCTRV